jgi:hypothetical protein
MIELSKTGAYYVGDGRFIEDGPEAKAALAAEGITATKEEAKKQNHGLEDSFRPQQGE